VSDVSSHIETSVFGDPQKSSEKKWGFKIDRPKKTKPISAKDIPKAANGNDYDVNYADFTKLTQNYINFLTEKKLHIPGLIPGFREELEQQHADNQSIDKDTYLTRLNELYEFSLGDEDRYAIPRCYNFTETKITDDQLTEIGDALGEINNRSGGRIAHLLRSIIVVPDDHPLMDKHFVDLDHGKGGGRTFSGYPLIILSESKIRNKKKLKKDTTPTDGEHRDLTVNDSLKSAVLHEAVHLWQFAEPEAAKKLEDTVTQSGETLSSRHGGAKMKFKGEERHMEILPEAIVALSSPQTEHLVGPITRQAVMEFQSTAFLKKDQTDDASENLMRATRVRCRQIDARTLSNTPPQEEKRWLGRIKEKIMR
jgi:hypothetical protein